MVVNCIFFGWNCNFYYNFIFINVNIINVYVVGVVYWIFYFMDFKCRFDIIEYKIVYFVMELFIISVCYFIFYYYSNIMY